MVDTQHFCLRWNNYQSSITSAFENLRDDEDFVDVTLACDGKSLKAHRVVLSACSPYFRELLKSTPCKHPVIVLQDVAWTDLHALVEFIYHGEVNVHQRSLSSFLKTAEVLRVSGLTQQHGDARDQLAQVQNMVRSQQVHQSTPIANHHHPSFAEKLVEDSLFPSRSSPPHGGGVGVGVGSNVNQLLRRAVAMQYRRERRISLDPDGEQHKRARGASSVADHLLATSNNNNNNNNNNELNLSHTHPPQTQPADFSPSGMKNNALNLNLNSNIKNEIEGNGISSSGDRDRSPCSPSPTGLHPSDPSSGLNLKSEPMEMLCSSGVGGGGVDSDDSTAENGTASDTMGNGPHAASSAAAAAAAAAAGLPQGPHSGGSSGCGVGGGGAEHDDRESAISPYLTATESKLFATAAAAGGFNFSMAALTGDPAALGLNQSLQGNDSLAGTSQGGVHGGLSAGAADDFRCQPCNKSLSSLTRLKRHIQNVHMRPSREPVCNICKRVYSSLNSLRNHKSIYHRNVKAVAKAEDVMAAAAAAAAAHSFYL